jgi:microcystin-dependent protein
MDNFYIATIMLFGAPWEPRGWKLCNGQLLSIAEFQALFSVIGTTYGGDGRTTFALPDLRGRTPIGMGHGAGLNPIEAGQSGGTETTTLTEAEMPRHTHQATLQNGTVAVSSDAGNATAPEGNVPAASNMVTRGDDVTGNIYAGDANAKMKSGSVSGEVAIGNSGGGRPFDNRSPWLGMNYIICVEGLYPSRN